jgi:hypothetical protein
MVTMSQKEFQSVKVIQNAAGGRLTAPPLPLEEHAPRRPAPITSAQKRKTSTPRIYNLGGRPALAPVT